MNRLSPTQLQDYCNDYIKTPNGKVLIVVVHDNDVNKCTMPEDVRYVIDANMECRFVFGNPQYSLTSNKKKHELTKAIIGTNIGEEDFDADWIAFYLHLARAIEKPIIIILTEEFYNTEECWPSLLFDVVEYAYPNLEEWLKWESQKSGVRLNDKLKEFLESKGGNDAFRKVNQWDWLIMSNSIQMGNTLLQAVKEATLCKINMTGARQSLYEDIKLYFQQKKEANGKKPIVDNDEALRLISVIQQGDTNAEDDLVKLCSTFVNAIARKYTGKGLTYEELKAVSRHELIRASHKFDLSSYKFTFAAYAGWWMREAIFQHAVQKNVARNQLHKEILNKIEEYIATGHKRPLLIWFLSNREIDEARRSIMNIPGCVRCDKYFYEKDGVIIEKRAIDYNEDTRLFLFHLYFGQLKAPCLEYAVNLMNKTGIPVVYLVNDYSKDEEPQADLSAFEECNTFAYL